jgi:hypothetical protein
MGNYCCKTEKQNTPIKESCTKDSEPVKIVINPITLRPNPGDITLDFENGNYIAVTDVYGQYLPTTDTFSDEDIICVLAVLTAENRMKETVEPLWTLTKTRKIPETTVSQRVKQRLSQIK